MRICLVSQEYPPDTAWGGIGTQTWVKARALARLGHEVHVLSRSRHQGPDLRTESQNGVTVHRMQPPGYDFPIYGKPLYMLGYTWYVVAALHKLMQQYTFDVLDFAEFGGEGFAYQIDRTVWNWVPVVVQLHGPLAMFVEIFRWPERQSRLDQLGRFMEEFSLKNADAIMAGSASVAELAGRYYGIPREAIDVVHGGVDTEAFTPPRGDDSLPNCPTVLFVGNIVENKGADVLAEAVLALRQKYPTIRLKLCGTGTEVPELIRARVKELGAEQNIEFAGFVESGQLPEFYRRAHVFCVPSEYETFPSVYLEAMACGCPVVASTSGGGGEAIADGETGLLVPPADVPATAAAIDRILGDPALRQRMSEAGVRRVAEHFTMEKFVRRIVAVYEKAIEFSRRLPEEAKNQSDWEVPFHYKRWPK